MTKKRIYITTAIPYVNASPHVGHALEFVQADCLSRFYRAQGFDVFFSSGADENSLKNVQAAEAEGIDTQELVDKYAKEFANLKEVLNISYDVFNRTSSVFHFEGAQKLWRTCQKEDIYKKNYQGLYCVGCEVFYTRDELIDGLCPEHKTKPELVEEENYFFKLSNYQKYLEELISKDELKISPESRKNEVLSFIKRGLEDFSISRSKKRARNWGVPIPGDEGQVMYVWYDALATYLTALGFGEKEKLFEKYWLENPKRLHVIGKGIIRFHAVYWPAILKSAGLPLPTEEFVHGYVTVDGHKISKSLGNTINPASLVEKYGIDPVRYYLLKEIPSENDGNFSEKRLVEIYNGELANGLGNLVSRVAKLAETEKVSSDGNLPRGLLPEINRFLESFEFDEAIKFIFSKIGNIDRFLNLNQPWKLTGEKKKDVVLRSVIDVIEIAYNLQPFLPQTAEKIITQFGGEIKNQSPLFPHL